MFRVLKKRKKEIRKLKKKIQEKMCVKRNQPGQTRLDWMKKVIKTRKD